MSTLTRRSFLRFSLAGLAGGVLARRAAAADRKVPKLAVSTWSFHNYFPNTRYGNPTFKLEEWKLQDVVRRVKEGLGLTALEVSSAHLASFEPGYLDELNGFLKDQGCRFIHLSDNFRGVNLARADAAKREEDVRTFERLIETARQLQIPTMRVNTGTPESKDWNLETTIETYRRLAKYGRERGVELIIENHFGISADPKNVARIIEAVGDNISSCPDFGLFSSDQERWPGLELMFKHCRRIVSAKFHGVSVDGQFKDFDVRRCYQIMKAAGFTGWASLEYEGPEEPLPQLQRMLRLAESWLKA
jgi:sugar phosphate isomerase/epimerase